MGGRGPEREEAAAKESGGVGPIKGDGVGCLWGCLRAATASATAELKRMPVRTSGSSPMFIASSSSSSSGETRRASTRRFPFISGCVNNCGVGENDHDNDLRALIKRGVILVLSQHCISVWSCGSCKLFRTESALHIVVLVFLQTIPY